MGLAVALSVSDGVGLNVADAKGDSVGLKLGAGASESDGDAVELVVEDRVRPFAQHAYEPLLSGGTPRPNEIEANDRRQSRCAFLL